MSSSKNQNHLLLKCICESPEDPERYSVYGDFLQEQGDPRGEFIAIQIAKQKAMDKGEYNKFDNLTQAENRIWSKYGALFLQIDHGPLAKYFDLRHYRNGFSTFRFCNRKYKTFPEHIRDLYYIRYKTVREFGAIRTGSYSGTLFEISTVQNQISHHGKCWHKNSKRSDNIWIYDAALISDDALVHDSEMFNDSYVFGKSEIHNSFLSGDSMIYGGAKVYKCTIGGNAQIRGNAKIRNCLINGDVIIGGNSIIEEQLIGDTYDSLIKISGRGKIVDTIIELDSKQSCSIDLREDLVKRKFRVMNNKLFELAFINGKEYMSEYKG